MSTQPPAPGQGPRLPAAQRQAMDISTAGRRRSDGNAALTAPPQMQVVGFHVEGASPSPLSPSMLQSGADVDPLSTGSPAPVIIPPSFERISSTARSSEAAAAAAAAVAAVSGNPDDSSSSRRSSAGGSASVALTPPAASDKGAANGPSTSSTPEGLRTASAITLPTAAAAAAAAAATAGAAAHSAPATLALEPRASAALPSPAHRAVADTSRHGGASPAPAQVAAAPASGGPPAGEKVKPSKTERRELQEKQRAEKAAAKGGASSSGAAAVAPQDKGAKGPERAGDKAASLQKAVAAAVAAGGSNAGGGGRGGHSGASSVQGGGHSRGGPTASTPDTPTTPGAGPAPSSVSASQSTRRSNAKAMSLNSTELFAHLQQYKRVTASQVLGQHNVALVHPAVLQLGLRYADGTIKGANARCMAMLNALSHVIRDYATPEGKTLARDLTVHLNGAISFLVDCRPLSFSMGNAIKHLKQRVINIDPAMPEAEAKAYLIQEVRDYVSLRITGADQLLIKSAVHKVETGDVVLTYAYSSIVYEVLVAAAAAGRRFRVIVVDSRPELEGRYMLQRLLQADIPCTYTHINGLSYIVREATKVFLGAAAVLSNGVVISRVGSAAVAMVANAHGRPVLICCESYKFHERVQLDSVTNNELGDPEALASVQGMPGPAPLAGWQETPRLGLLNLKYDAMPAEYVTMIISEFGMIPATSVPVILREYRQDI